MESDKTATKPRKSGRVTGALRALTRNKESIFGLAIVVSFLLIAAVVELSTLLNVTILPYSPTAEVAPGALPPSLKYLFGTDNLGRDLFSRIVSATPYDIAIGYIVVGSAFVIGALLGGYAGIRGGILDEILMRFTDVFFALPVLVLALVIAAVLGTGVTNMAIALMIVWWPAYARLARGEALKVAHQNYIEAARLSGNGHRKILFRHVLPNISGTMLVYATLDIGTVILVYSGLTYLGLAVHPPTPDWGEMVSDYHSYILSAPWLALFPGLVISLGVIGFSLLGDGVKDAQETR
ncbi:MAG: ABC transporter permease [Thaumarchaeota archaeon]|nr:ABC transporter permease [Nitrososphaerota archaeon]